MTKKMRARTTVNDGWKQPKKRKPMTPEQRIAAAQKDLKKARAAKQPAKNEFYSSIYS